MTPNAGESLGGGAGRLRATDQMRARADDLERQASDWRALAKALDAIQQFACDRSSEGGDDAPYIGVGSQAELFLWRLASDSIR